MKYFVTLLSACCIIASSHAFVSAKRLPEQSYQQAMEAALKKASIPMALLSFESPVSMAVSFEDISFDNVPVVPSGVDLQKMFDFLRDNRFLTNDDDGSFLRRISWLYPDDGCFARAAAVDYLLKDKAQIEPAKVFAFGALSVATPNSPRGEVSWWYHVAPIVAYNNTYYVFDPAIEPNYPMLVEEWFASMNPDYKYELTGVICHPQTYHTVDSCFNPTTSHEVGIRDEKRYLASEWYRVIELGYDPNLVLGDSPPWGMASGVLKQLG